MDTILQFLTGVLRYVLPVLALLILAVCVISLFRNRPRVHKMAQLVDQNNGSVMDITHWETSIGKSKYITLTGQMPLCAGVAYREYGAEQYAIGATL